MFEHELRIEQATADDGIRWNRDLVASGLTPEVHYVWRYQPSYYDNFSHYNSTPRAVVFEFQDPALATFYRLKWHC
jgi:hypothetical protein